jgi:rod shape-determining protein MreC
LKNSIAIIIAILILIISFLAFTNTPLIVRGYSALKGGFSETIGPMLSLIAKPADLVRYVFNSYVNLVGAKRENAELKKRLDIFLLENQKIPDLERENKRLRTLLNFVEKNPRSMIAARVVGEDLKNWYKCIIIDKGGTSNIKEKMPVITPRGIVGQAVEVDRWHTKVMVINDTNSSVDVSAEGKNTRGLLEGTGQTVLKLKYVLKNDDIEIGDKLLTSGKDGIYPKGLPAGIVITVNRNKPGIFADIDIMPFSNFKHLEEVLVIKRQ